MFTLSQILLAIPTVLLLVINAFFVAAALLLYTDTEKDDTSRRRLLLGIAVINTLNLLYELTTYLILPNLHGLPH